VTSKTSDKEQNQMRKQTKERKGKGRKKQEDAKNLSPMANKQKN